MTHPVAPAVSVERMLHVVCLPLYVRSSEGREAQPVHLRRVADRLTHSGVWVAGPAPQGEKPDRWDAYRSYQARAYFHPFVRRFLFDSRAVARFHRRDVCTLLAEVGHWRTGDFECALDVLRCELFVFQPDVVILRLEVSPKQAMPLQEVMVMMDRLRRIYPPYVDFFETDTSKKHRWLGGHCAQKVKLCDANGTLIGIDEPMSDLLDDPAAGPPSLDAHVQRMLRSGNDPAAAHRPFAHWRSLLQPLTLAGDPPGRSDLRLHLLADDRATTLTWLAVDDPRRITDGDWMRLCFCDEAGDSAMQPYAREFSRRFAERHFYDRYWYEGSRGQPAGEVDGVAASAPSAVDNDMDPSRILNCGYAFAYVGSSQDKGFFVDELRGAHAIFRHIYCDMAMVAMFQKSALLSASLRLTEMVARVKGGSRIQLPPTGEVRAFYEHFVEFTQRFWFDEISPQEQGRELFEMWRHNLGTQRLYDEVRQELLDLVQYTELRAGARLNRLVARFGVLSLFTGVVGAVAAVYALDGVERFKGMVPALVPAGWLPAVLLGSALGLGVLSLLFALRQRRLDSSDPP